MDTTGVRVTTVAVGFVVAFGVILLVLSAVGVRATASAVATANSIGLIAVLAAVVLWAGAWTYTFSIVLHILDVDHGPIGAVLMFGDVLFANSVAPSTYLGGEPLAAFFLTRHTGRDYETSFATVSSVDLLNYAPMLPLAGIGVVYITVTAALGRRVEFALLAVVAVFGFILGGIVLGWQYRRRAIVGTARLFGGLSTRVSAVVPGIRAVSVDRLYDRLELFVEEVERVTADRRNLKRALVSSTAGWLCLSLALWLAVYAVGYKIPPEIALFIVPLGATTNVLPLPGGLGTVESVFILLLVATAGVPAVEAAAATLLYRAATYWLPLFFGVGTVAVSYSPWLERPRDRS
ncbi:lysylphosphatidylglycerol synthase transmembrane domain-containing protein [Natronorubrum halophilum]|uniref:lysylphosphatidylglycerol synthase transmembrane domain-containing protein n=1 Tax=Natronorubrum halophilum TaxID=1702106 RepID=UPI000EF6E191|nr:lysylphosphatidylglycerol synthase transmembrane domain-containing protein [Natronorubrum halophilum]